MASDGSDFRAALQERALVADGAMGTMLNSRGVGFERSFEGLNLTDPDLVRSVHEAFVHAGADIIETNTFSATDLHLERWGLGNRAADINASAVRVARAAAQQSPRRVFVAGSIGPIGSRLAPLGPLSVDDARAAFSKQVSVLANEGVDLLVFETFADIDELDTAILAAQSICALPIVASMSFTRDVRTVGDVVPEVAFERLRALGVSVIGANCSTGPRGVYEVLSRYAEAAADRVDVRASDRAGVDMMFAAMPNAGYPESRGDRLHYPAPPDYFQDYGRRFLAVGARIVGGCCGTTPEHVQGLRRAVDDPTPLSVIPAAPRRSSALTVTTRSPRSDGTPTDAASASPDRSAGNSGQRSLVDALDAGAFVTTVEVEPPKSANTEALEAVAVQLRDAGVTTLNISDTPMARMRMTGLAAAVRVQHASGINPVLHFPVRGRNLLRVQGDLLAAHALGVRTLFVTMGDLASIGDYPQSFDHHDIVPTGLVKLVKQHFNSGVDRAGSSIGEPCQFRVGVAVNLTPEDLDAEVKLLAKKIAFGADFGLTQPVFDVERAKVFLARYEEQHGPLALPLLVGVLPLASVRHAVFLKNEVPGMRVPTRLVERMDRAGSEGRAEGTRIAEELLAEVRAIASGVYFIPAFRRYDVIAELVASLG